MALRTARRRPWLVAVVTGLAMLRFLPGGEPVVAVEIVAPSGGVQRVFNLMAHDAKLESLRQAAEDASHPDYRKRSPDYYRAQWDAESADFYLAHTRQPEFADAPAAGKPELAAAVSPVAYQQEQATAVQASATAVASDRDWNAFWLARRAGATERMRSLEPPPRVDPLFARMRFGSVRPGPYPVPSVFVALCGAVVAFLVTARWACRPPQRLIGLRAAQRLEVPAEWIRQRRSWRELRTAWSWGAAVEASAVLALVVLLIL
ncbi:hypothetical protein [Candidatus Laterigemmans baculatus]|uniref:hypothetical protein n=1 Tax=Candidatus Laterigemmans baculatus TaxID=2770505 RepID=UPI0013DC18A3|nr:hypothetical protein [Candidatus Laterigemmans baculatus]